MCEFLISPHIIFISETKIRSQSITNINLSNFDFVYANSPTNFGGVGIYINKKLDFNVINKNNLGSNFENVFIIVKVSSKLQLLIGAIYRHPKMI